LRRLPYLRLDRATEKHLTKAFFQPILVKVPEARKRFEHVKSKVHLNQACVKHGTDGGESGTFG